MKSAEIRSFFWSVFSHIRTEYGLWQCGKIRTRKNCISGHFSRSGFDRVLNTHLGKCPYISDSVWSKNFSFWYILHNLEWDNNDISENPLVQIHKYVKKYSYEDSFQCSRYSIKKLCRFLLLCCSSTINSWLHLQPLQMNVDLNYGINPHISFHLKYRNFHLFRVLRSGQKSYICPCDFKTKT